ncbi:hypothetical protein [Paraburkholderia dinghuensis]|uniref:Uncharacterized protein n=1 Tax=Paraburkholderia dinghuensis TaxID=2305225 RepID=A0A3N6N656_9BURK|nr:hypothetical protein [Paraburkholderia dinghuensis]RQH04402.1 hypothetical protein D1Y85_18230 [Paraburkholderia dinghuensis]
MTSLDMAASGSSKDRAAKSCFACGTVRNRVTGSMKVHGDRVAGDRRQPWVADSPGLAGATSGTPSALVARVATQAFQIFVGPSSGVKREQANLRRWPTAVRCGRPKPTHIRPSICVLLMATSKVQQSFVRQYNRRDIGESSPSANQNFDNFEWLL